MASVAPGRPGALPCPSPVAGVHTQGEPVPGTLPWWPGEFKTRPSGRRVASLSHYKIPRGKLTRPERVTTHSILQTHVASTLKSSDPVRGHGGASITGGQQANGAAPGSARSQQEINGVQEAVARECVGAGQTDPEGGAWWETPGRSSTHGTVRT